MENTPFFAEATKHDRSGDLGFLRSTRGYSFTADSRLALTWRIPAANSPVSAEIPTSWQSISLDGIFEHVDTSRISYIKPLHQSEVVDNPEKELITNWSPKVLFDPPAGPEIRIKQIWPSTSSRTILDDTVGL